MGLPALAQQALTATLGGLGANPARFEASLLACDDARIAELNSAFRGKPTPTNVLSWPAEERSAETAGGRPEMPQAPPDGPPVELGDIAIAYETCQREAQQAGIAMQDHVVHLLVHALLHLLGYDHIRDQDATLMEAVEVRTLAQLGIADPYGDGCG